MPIDLPEGKWTFLCLGGKVGDYEIGIFKTGIPQQFSPAVSPGITTLSDFRVKAYFEQKENLEYSLGELFFGRLDSVEITADNGGTGVVDLMKNTNKIEVRVKGIADGSSARITVRLYMFLIIAHLKRMIPVFSSLMYCACILTGICSLNC